MRPVLISLFVLPGLVAAQVPIDQILKGTASVTRFSETAISPDGRRVAYVQTLRNKDNSESRNKAIYLVDVASSGAKGKRISAGNGKADFSESGVAWSPDSSHLAFLSDQEKRGQVELYVEDGKNSPRKLTSLTGFLSTPRWSPDGKQIAILFTENAPRAAGPLEPATHDQGVVEDKFYEQRLTLVDATTGSVRIISPADTYVYEYDWSPNNKELAFTAAKGNGDNNWWIAQLFVIDAAGGPVRFVTKPETQIAVPRFSPDGKTIAFIGGLMSDEGSTGGDVFTVPSSGGNAKDVTPGRKSSPSWLRWEGNQKLLIAETVDGGHALSQVNLVNGESETLWKGDESMLAGEDTVSVASDNRISAVIRNSWTQAPEVFAGSIGDWHPLTQANTTQKPMWGKSEKIHWQSDGVTVQGWLIYPQTYDASKRYPMVVGVHGGPAGAKTPSWPGGFDPTLLSAGGYFVLMANPRGSYGAGEAFTRANVKDFGYGDLHDILAGVDQVLKTLPIDPKRVGLTGWSYGGFMTMFGVTQTDRFRAAVAGAGISNWQSYYGQNLIDQWMIPYFGASVYDDPAAYSKSSAIDFIKNVHTPTLVVVGDSDAECPAPQSYEFWHALKTLNVKTQLVIYPNEGHRFHDPEHQRDVMRRLAGWFDENMPASN
jgi:dipeptidyl aminopeptidase/acylaminoacyl peptidase